MLAGTAILRRIEGIAGALACHHVATGSHGQRAGAAVAQVTVTTHPAAIGTATGIRSRRISGSRRRYVERQVVAVNERDVVEVVVAATVQCEFRQRNRRLPAGAVAVEDFPTVPCFARAGAGAVEIAAASSPDSAGPGRSFQCLRLPRLENETRFLVGDRGKNSGPHSLSAFVNQCENGRATTRKQWCEQKQNENSSCRLPFQHLIWAAKA